MAGSHVPKQCRSCGGFCGGGYGNKFCQNTAHIQTHYTGCWKDPKHHSCALRYIQELENVIAMHEQQEVVRDS